ncbi:acyl-CoA carboxylase epsilon subunit [Streptomyces sp. NPDC051366]|uniref:acyl-CoA carboxylase epsilon subunit n=1 Tax=Streptomyces sp. NPDC051366 TaxID=3365652 RepID=UPI0037BC6078
MTSSPDLISLLRVEKGRADPEELAAVAVVLLAWATRPPAPPPVRRTVGWRRLERTQCFRAPHSWQ